MKDFLLELGRLIERGHLDKSIVPPLEMMQIHHAQLSHIPAYDKVKYMELASKRATEYFAQTIDVARQIKIAANKSSGLPLVEDSLLNERELAAQVLMARYFDLATDKRKAYRIPFKHIYLHYIAEIRSTIQLDGGNGDSFRLNHGLVPTKREVAFLLKNLGHHPVTLGYTDESGSRTTCRGYNHLTFKTKALCEEFKQKSQFYLDSFNLDIYGPDTFQGIGFSKEHKAWLLLNDTKAQQDIKNM